MSNEDEARVETLPQRSSAPDQLAEPPKHWKQIRQQAAIEVDRAKRRLREQQLRKRNQILYGRNQIGGLRLEDALLGPAIIATRKALGITQRQLAAASGLSRDQVIKIEKGRVEDTYHRALLTQTLAVLATRPR